MLPASYYSKVKDASRRVSTGRYRDQVAHELVGIYDAFEQNNKDFNFVDVSRALFDAGRLLGMHDRKVTPDWTYDSINSITLKTEVDEKVEPQLKELRDQTSQKIEKFRKQLHISFKDFEVEWCDRQFDSTQAYLQAFYRYIPYVKLGIDEEPEVQSLGSDATVLQKDLARQGVVVRRVEMVFMQNKPDDMPEAIVESLIDYAIRVGEESIPGGFSK